MSVARHHNDWLRLIEISGPFLSMPVLMRIFPQGLDAHDSDHCRLLRNAYEEWLVNKEKRRPDPGIHQEWVRFVLKRTLGFDETALGLREPLLKEGQSLPAGLEVRFPEHHEVLRPDMALVNPAGTPNAGRPRMLIWILPPEQNLDKALAGKEWKATPGTRMMELLRACDIKLGLATNGEQWMLVHAPRGQTTSFITWMAHLWLEEHTTLRAFRSLLGPRLFFGVEEGDTLESLFAESAVNQQEVTDQLGYQVRKAVEVLVHALDREDKDRGRALLADVDEKEIYDAALTFMMRLVFLFSAEERGLILLGDPLYDQFYAISTLRSILREEADQYGEEVLERRHDAWCRLLATFRGIHGGINHDRLRLPAYGGRLFDPDRYPFLEGRNKGTTWRITPANPLPINNRTVLHLLEALQILQVKVPGGGPPEARRLSFRALDIEQIGHVYEGLLDHAAFRAAEPILGLVGTRDSEEEIPLAELERHLERGQDELVEYLAKRTKRSTSALKKALDGKVQFDEQRLRVACENEPELLARVLPFAGLVRNDTNGYPVVVPTGSIYVTQGSDRRSTGTHYTPRILTEPIVQHTLEPLVYHGPAEGKPKEEWQLRSARELLDLKVCDMAMGSGAFLVQACRYLSERLVEAWEAAEKDAGGRLVVTPEGDLSTGAPEERPIPRDVEERLALARRVVSERCLYGVDINPMAVEMAKLSLWLTTMDKGRAFTFLDHALKCGDSLIGLSSIEQVMNLHIAPEHMPKNQQMPLWFSNDTAHDLLLESLRKRQELESFSVNEIADSRRKEQLLKEADAATSLVRLVCDLVVGVAIATADGNAAKRGGAPSKSFEEERERLLEEIHHTIKETDGESQQIVVTGLVEESHRLLSTSNGKKRVPFHWAIEFSEVFPVGVDRAGFDAFIGNPPFMGGQKITGNLGTDYRNFIVDHLAAGTKGSADLCAYFFLRAYDLLREGGRFGLLATNTIAQGDTRDVGLDRIARCGASIPRAIPSRAWPGDAALEVSHVWVHKGAWQGEWQLNDQPVTGITPLLVAPGKATGKPYRLAANEGKSFQGSIVLGMGFVLSPEEAQDLIAKDPRNKDVLFPYLNGQDLNSRPDQSPSRWVINFFDWPLNREARGSWVSADDRERKAWLHVGVVPKDYPDPVASDYPDCISIVERRVKPERMRLKREIRKRRWWQFAERAPALYSTIAGMERVLVACIVTQYFAPAFCPATHVYAHRCCVFPLNSWSAFSSIQSTAHEIWAREYSSSLETRLNYSPSDCLETFPFPKGVLEGKGAGAVQTLGHLGEICHEYRRNVTLARHEGLTRIYNRFHDPGERSEDIARLRELHVEMDQTVAAAYGWTDLDLGHGFQETKQGVRYTISESARREVLDRLLLLNHERYAQEVAEGLHDKKGKRKAGQSRQAKELTPSFLEGQ